MLSTGTPMGRKDPPFPVERLADATPDQRLWFEAYSILRREGSEAYPAIRDLPKRADNAAIRDRIVDMVGSAAYMRGDFGPGRKDWDAFLSAYPSHRMADEMRRTRAAEAKP